MKKNPKKYNRRQFLELTALGTASTLALNPSILMAQTPKRGGTLTVGAGFLMQTPDPHRYIGIWGRQCTAPSWEGLTTPIPVTERLRILKEQGPDADVPFVQPMLADSWDIENGGKRYVFHLKKGVKFHNGKELDSEDVKWNWERIKDPHNITGARKFLTHFLESIETPDPYTIVANLSNPYGGFLSANAWCYTPIMPKDSIPNGATWGLTPTFKPTTVAPPGTGPFKMVEYQQIHQAVYERFDNYRIEGLPYLDKLVYKVMQQHGPRTMAMRAGNIDFTWSVESAWLEPKMKGRKLNEPFYLEQEKLNLLPTVLASTSTIYLNCHPEMNSPFKDERVRQALAYCIDNETLAKALYRNLGIPVHQGFNPDVSSWGFPDIQGRKRDINKAKALLTEAGYPNGLDVRFKITPIWGKNDLRAQIIQQMAKPAGFRITITSQVGSQYSMSFRTYDYDMMMQSIRGEDPMEIYYTNLHTDPAAPYNGHSPRLGVKDPEMDRLLDEMATEPNGQKRRAIFKQITLRANDKAYWIPNDQEILAAAWSNRLKNFNPQNYFQAEHAFTETWLEDA